MKRAFLFLSFALAFTPVLTPLLGCGSTVGTGSGGAGGHTTTSSATAASAASSSSTSTSTSSGAGGCSPACESGLTCCGGVCVNPGNDVKNCGACGNVCPNDLPYCDKAKGLCADPPCNGAITCGGNSFCCNMECCAPGTICCDVPGPGPTMGAKCVPPENGTCPPGCPICK